MNLGKFVLGYRDFYSKNEIIIFIKNSKNYKNDLDLPRRADALLIFMTSKQQTWIVCSKIRLYIILDDIQKDTPNIIKSISKKRLMGNSQLVAKIVEKEKSEKSGRIVINEMIKGYLFTKSIFSNISITQQLSSLIQTQMN